jgi:hypothetical protein
MKTTEITTTTAVALSLEAIDALAKFRQAKDAEKQAKALKAEAEAILRAELGDATVGTVLGLPVVKVINSKNSHIDKEALYSAFPDAYEATLVETPYDYLRAV